MSTNSGGSGGGIVPSYSNNMGLARQTHARRQVPGACRATGGRAPFRVRHHPLCVPTTCPREPIAGTFHSAVTPSYVSPQKPTETGRSSALARCTPRVATSSSIAARPTHRRRSGGGRAPRPAAGAGMGAASCGGWLWLDSRVVMVYYIAILCVPVPSITLLRPQPA